MTISMAALSFIIPRSSIPPMLVTLLGLVACALSWGQPGRGGMMGGGDTYSPDAEQISIDDAAETVGRYLRAYYGRDLVLIEVIEFTWNFYAKVEEKTTGIHAVELLIDKYTGQVSPEMGPNMMWNTKYGMMGSYYKVSSSTVAMSITQPQAKELAQRFLDINLPGVTAGEADTFYGYYTLHTPGGEKFGRNEPLSCQHLPFRICLCSNEPCRESDNP